MNTRPKAYSYLRFSSPAQMEGDSFRRQTTLAHKYALEKGFDLDESLTFHDLGVSAYRGANAESGRLADFKEAVRVGLVPPNSYLLVETLDRLSRLTPRKAVRVLEDIIEMGITVVTLNDGKEYTEESLEQDPINLLMAIIYFIRANEESATKGRRIKAAWEGKRLKATDTPLTAICPAWMSLDKTSNKFVLDTEKAEVIRWIFKKILEGVGLEAIARHLNRANVPPFGRGKVWHKSYITKIRGNPAVIGTFVPHQQEYTSEGLTRVPLDPVLNYYPAVIDEETFNRVNAMSRSTAPKTRTAQGIKSVLAGLATCHNCGSTMTRVTKGSSTRSGKPVLVCTSAKIGKGCKYRGVNQEDIERELNDNLKVVLSSPPIPDQATEEKRSELHVTLEAVEDEIENIVDALSKKRLPALLSHLEDLENQRDSVKAEIKAIDDKAANSNYGVILSRVDALYKTLGDEPTNITKINAHLRQLFKGVVVDYEMGTLDFLWQQGGITSAVFAWPENVQN